MYIVLFSCARTGAQPPQQSTPSANYRNRVNIQRDRAGASSDDEHQQVLQQIL
jgi:starch synthase